MALNLTEVIMLKNKNTNGNYTPRQLKLPLEIEKIIDISDPVYTFCDEKTLGSQVFDVLRDLIESEYPDSEKDPPAPQRLHPLRPLRRHVKNTTKRQDFPVVWTGSDISRKWDTASLWGEPTMSFCSTDTVYVPFGF